MFLLFAILTAMSYSGIIINRGSRSIYIALTIVFVSLTIFSGSYKVVREQTYCAKEIDDMLSFSHEKVIYEAYTTYPLALRDNEIYYEVKEDESCPIIKKVKKK